MIDLEDVDMMPDEPFRLLHNGVASFGRVASFSGNVLSLWDGSRTLDIDETYESVVEDQKVVFTSAKYESEIEVSPIVEADAVLLADPDSVETLEDLRTAAAQALEESAVGV